MLKKLNVTPGSIILMVIFIVMSIAQYIFYNQDLDEYRTEVNNIENGSKDITWSLISSTYDMVELSANERAEILAKNIVDDIKKQYPDLSVLKILLDQGNIQDTMLPFIIYKNTQGHQMLNMVNENNACFVMSRDGYIMDTRLIEYNRSWHSFNEETSFDAEALYLMLELINGHKEKCVIYTNSTDNSNGLPKLVHGDKDDIKAVFYDKGFDGLKNFTFYGKSYITETGDIFGTEDINNNAIRVNNHKLIVVQKFNLYDILEYHYGKDIEINRITFDNMKHELEKSMLIRSITYFALLFLNIIAMLIIIFWSNINSRFAKK